MAAINREDRARLITTGNRLMAHAKKHLTIMMEAQDAGNQYPKATTIMVRFDLQQLIAVGEVLGKDGLVFTLRGAQLANSPCMAAGLTTIEAQAKELVECWDVRQEIGRAEFEAQAKKFVADYSEKDAKNPPDDAELRLRRDCLVWSEEDFLGCPTDVEKYGEKKNCTFCGARSFPTFPERVLLTCGRCKIALYCDKRCQEMDLKYHKEFCKKTKKTKTLKESKTAQPANLDEPAEDDGASEGDEEEGGVPLPKHEE
ncbi:unnamed protein product [Zymoseptoria tritici ST99CH_3D7]|uniref:MYND-type domain-containing protein n=1 Tax=Zymoseptoria tritici (strain ST99CH_3D7) TaxID=1276538 RepID=A0A1X7S0I5_ZYMT9|nr:unnamed protein product [Zymoseptoria tritici ST99CH_3D7]